jgi:selenocysteine-specific elongation factor
VERHVVIGTAGHVDHGKTALVKALTGVDTDRWEEEKRRGITIDLGFASLDLAGGVGASVVDVPGHEDFVRNMVAGATGVDVALLVVAADEGVMPQTVEHAAILRFLDVRAGVVALTKADLVEQEWLDLVRADVEQRLADSPIKWERPVPVSSLTGQGLDQLRSALATAAHQARERETDDLFRLPVDRIFSLAGAGTVVTGTTWSGSVGVGDHVVVHPGAVRARVRSIEVHGQPRERASPGCRTALALVGLDRAAAGRGSVVVADQPWRATTALDVVVTLLPEARPLDQRSRIKLHLGTSEVPARIVPLGERIGPGATAEAARLRLEEPIVARWGDRGVLRATAPVTTIGGCVVVDPWPAPRPRRPVGAAARADRDPIERVRAFAAASGPRGLSVEDLPVRVGVHPRDLEAVLRGALRAGLVQAGSALIPQSTAAAARELAIGRLSAFHREHPLQSGMPLEAFRRLVGQGGLAAQLLHELAGEGVIAREGEVVRLSQHRAALSTEQAAAGAHVRAQLRAARFQGRTATELGADAPIAEFFVREGTAVRVGKDRYYDRRAIEEMVQTVLAAIQERGQVSPSELRAGLGLTRKHLIPILEWMDGQGLTVRVGDVRRAGRAAHLPTGNA